MTYLDVLANKILCGVPKEAIPTEKISDLFRLYAVLLLAKGEGVTTEDVHNAWVAWMQSLGREHESMVPFSELDVGTQAEDAPFVDAIHAVAHRKNEET